MAYSWRIVVTGKFLGHFRISDEGISIFFNKRITDAQFYPINQQLLDLFDHFNEELL